MYINVNGIWLTSERPETYTQAYHAGALYATIENSRYGEHLPPFVECMVHFAALRELLGERIWQKLKVHSKFKNRIAVYEKLTYQPFLPKAIIGTSREFCLGYIYVYKRTKLKAKTDLKRTQDIQKIIDYLSPDN